jgi:cobalt-zinc-cadmium efflux system protein
MGNPMKMGSGHGGHMPASSNTRALVITGWLTGIYFLIELGIGFYTGSISVLSDAFHTFSAVGGIVLAFIAARIARRPADAQRTFGSSRAEIIGALLNGMFLLLMAIFVFVMGSMRLGEPVDLPTGPMLFAALGGLATEVVSIALLFGGQKDNINMRGAFWHVMQTFVGSILIIVAALVIRFTGFIMIDPLLGMAFGVVLLFASFGIIREALTVLMEGTPIDLNLDEVVRTLSNFPTVINVHHVHAWTLTSGKIIFSAHIRAKNGTDTDELLHHVSTRLRDDYGVYFSTIQIETGPIDEALIRDLDYNQLITDQN